MEYTLSKRLKNQHNCLSEQYLNIFLNEILRKDSDIYNGFEKGFGKRKTECSFQSNFFTENSVVLGFKKMDNKRPKTETKNTMTLVIF